MWGLGDLFWWGVGGVPVGRKFLLNLQAIEHFTEHLSFLQVFFMHFADAGYLPGFCVD